MTFTVHPTTDPAVKTITCDQCGDYLPSLWESVRDSWKRAHVCTYHHTTRLDEKTKVRP